MDYLFAGCYQGHSGYREVRGRQADIGIGPCLRPCIQPVGAMTLDMSGPVWTCQDLFEPVWTPAILGRVCAMWVNNFLSELM